MKRPQRLRVGLALGSGSARGWAHIGVIRTLRDAGIKPDIVCGTSIGALVGAAYAMGKLDEFEQWVEQLSWQDVVGFLDLSMSGGLIKGTKLMGFLRDRMREANIADLHMPFAAVATDLHTGREVWLQKGSVFQVARASIALPGLFTPVLHEGRYLVDGGLVNPVPVSLARALGADIVIAVDLNSDLIGRHDQVKLQAASTPIADQDDSNSIFSRLQSGFESMFSNNTHDTESDSAGANAPPEPPSMIDVLSASINIMQVRITRSRLAGEPADIMIAPRLARFALLDFHRASEAIAEGVRATENAIPEVEALLGPTGQDPGRTT